jgi:serine/threonine protein kinase/Flp pilus assembly protein TadD
MADAWGRGERVTAAKLLESHPDLDTEAVIRLIYEEVCLRREAGLAVDTALVVRQFPRWADELQDLFDCDRLLGPMGTIAAFPEVGETLGPFQLLAELGRGASGRTYLATDPGLADRPVVVKVVPGDQDEHLALARLRHTHIVPLFSEHHFPERDLRVLCMPYLGGASLAQILNDLAEIPRGRRSGKLLVALIDRNTRTTPAPPHPDGPFRRSLEQATYIQAITWIVSCLAEAIHYAQAHGFVHMDIKPSNVLITVDGQPMLLDFHLARGPIQLGDTVADRLGGTPGWMSPEQVAAVEAVEEGRPARVAVDGRTDIFALGLLLRAALAAPGSAWDGRDARTLVPGLPSLSVGLGDILRKCVAPEPSDRYEDAATLAEDLRRHINDLPLRGVGNRSPIERWRKWRRRHPGTFAWGITALATLLATTVALAVSAAAYRQRVGQLQIALEDGRRYNASGQYGAAMHTLERGLANAGTVPAVRELTRALNEERRRAERGQLAAELHDVADLIRFRYGIDLPSHEDAQALVRNCRVLWEQRGHLIPTDGAAIEFGSEPQITTDLLELAAVWADLRVLLAPPADRDAARRDALRVLDEADALFGPSLAVDLRRQPLAPAPGRAGAAGARARAPRSAWEHYDLGRYDLRSGRFAPAAAEFRRALDLRPQDFWSNFFHGLCTFRLHQYAEAVAAFRTCLALATGPPQAAICRYNRALAQEALGQTVEASDDYTHAIELDPTLTAALLNRGILYYNRGRYREAIDDYEHVLSVPPTDPQTLGRVRYNLALAQLALGDRASALATADEAIRHGCQEARPLSDALLGGRAVLLPPARGTPVSSPAEPSAPE